MLSIRSIQQKEKTIAAGLREKLALLALELRVEQDRVSTHPSRARRAVRAENTKRASRIGIEGHDGTGVEIVAGALFACEHGVGIASAQ